MSATNAFETSLLTLLFNNTNLANVGDATGLRGSTAAGSFFIALYTTAPTDSTAGTEANYTGYARVAVNRTSGGWTISGNNASNTGVISFPACTGGTNTVTSFGILTASTAGDLLIYGALSANRTITDGITPEFAAGELDVNLD
jgi:hypothetical protein